MKLQLTVDFRGCWVQQFKWLHGGGGDITIISHVPPPYTVTWYGEFLIIRQIEFPNLSDLLWCSIFWETIFAHMIKYPEKEKIKGSLS